MAFFEPQEEIDNEAFRAVACAKAMRRELGKMNEEGAFPDHHQVQIGIGINSGEVVAGNIGSKHRMDYTLIGDNVNLAARLESNAKSGEILVSSATVKRLAGLAPTDYLDTIIVKGRSEPVEVYQVPE
jgi:adenylate cyclase